jgi:transposase InsO family protein
VSHGVSRLRSPKEKRQGKFKDYAPGFVHIDHFNLPAIGAKKRYCFVAIDRATRLAYLKIYNDKTAKSALDFLKRAIEFFPFNIHRLLSDNGPEFTNRRYTKLRGGPKAIHPLDALCRQHQILRRYTAPWTPATNGMAERFVGLCKQATVKKYRYKNHQAAEDALLRWIVFYNLNRKHGGIQRRTPIQQATQGYKLESRQFNKEPDPHCRAFLT